MGGSSWNIELVVDTEAMKAAFREALERFTADREEKPVKMAMDYLQYRMREFVRVRKPTE